MSNCKGCGRSKEEDRWEQWWGLRNYYGFTGSFCGDCYDKISHDSYGRPERPGDHLLMRIKLGLTGPQNEHTIESC